MAEKLDPPNTKQGSSSSSDGSLRHEELLHPWWDREILHGLYQVEGKTRDEISDILDCSRDTVDRWIKKHNLDSDDEERKNQPDIQC